MIRFIDMRGQGTGFRFSFFDTSADHFVEGSVAQGWNDKADVESDTLLTQKLKDQLINLLPGWAMHNEETDEETSSKDPHKPDTLGWTWEGILGQLNRYGGSPDDRLFEILDYIADINDDMAHGRLNKISLFGIQVCLDKLCEELLGPYDILSPFDSRVLTFLFLTQRMEVEPIPDFQKIALQVLGPTENAMNASIKKLTKLGFIQSENTPLHKSKPTDT